ncbi:MAG: hypothetical protein A2051_07385 [Desulfovibrionales bacterium GWA2_65_9]|nr:MAG: hypothetical protein A2051_07385 [Desulfovibrionales bacterium GWA2_65_9]
MFWLYATLAWLGFAVLAVALGTLRVLFLEPLTGEPVAHVLGTLAGCALFMAIIYWFVGRFVGRTNLRARGRLLALGLFWTVLTIAFEFGFGHYVRGLSWQLLLADYNILAGRIWVLVLLTLYAGPRLAAWAIIRWRK